MTKKFKYIIAGLLAAIAFAAVPTVASASYDMPSASAVQINDQSAAYRCQNANAYVGGGFFCANPKTAGGIIGGDGYSWYVETDYDIATWTGAPQLRHCIMIGHYHAYYATAFYVSPGC